MPLCLQRLCALISRKTKEKKKIRAGSREGSLRADPQIIRWICAGGGNQLAQMPTTNTATTQTSSRAIEYVAIH